MVRWLLLIVIVSILPGVFALNETLTCTHVFNFIIEHYDPIENRLDFTDEDFDVLQMQTTALPGDLKNRVMYYEDLCEEELPFINYNNSWPEEEKDEKPTQQSSKEGFDKFIETLKEDIIVLGLGVLGIVIILYLIAKYG